VLARLYLFLLVGCWFVGPFILSPVYPVTERECGSRAGTGASTVSWTATGDGELDGDRRRGAGRREGFGERRRPSSSTTFFPLKRLVRFPPCSFPRARKRAVPRRRSWLAGRFFLFLNSYGWLVLAQQFLVGYLERRIFPVHI
jgi:hypothetical protein